MNSLKKKLGKNGGFTLIEMLIVVAIIAILVAVSIPLINGALERARDATDQANERAAKAEAVLLYMGVAETATGTFMEYDEDTAYYYDAAEGSLKEMPGSGDPDGMTYGKCTGICTNTVFMYGDGPHAGGYLTLPEGGITSNGVVTFEWAIPA